MIDLESYLDRIRYDGALDVDLETLSALQRAHLTSVPFENLMVYAGTGVRTDLAWSVNKIVQKQRGGWCFEVNGAFAALLEAIGFQVRRLGAAVLLNGPNVLIDHVTLEVALDEPWLVDVGFGESFTRPLALNLADPQDGGNGQYQFLPSPQGTTLAMLEDGIPTACYRFKRVAHQMADFDGASERLQTDPASPFRDKPFATRLLGNGSDRVTLLRNRLKLTQGGVATERPVEPNEWAEVLQEWFGITPGALETPEP